MSLRKLHIILSKTYLCPSVYTAKKGFLNRLDNITSVLDANNGKLSRSKFKDMNIFIQHIGQLKLCTDAEKHPYVLRMNQYNDKITRNGQYSLSACYRAEGNLSFMVSDPESGVTIEIQPIVHIFPSGIVSIMFSCLFNSENRKQAPNLDMFRQLLKSFSKGTALNHMETNNPAFRDVNSLEICIDRICFYIRKAFPELDFNHSYYMKTSFVQIEHDRKLSEKIFKDLCSQMMPNSLKLSQPPQGIPNEAYNLEADPYMLVSSDFSTIHYSFAAHKVSDETPCFHSWQFYRYLEFAVSEMLVYNFLIDHSDNVKRDIEQQQYSLFDKAFKPTFYSKRIDTLYQRQEARFEATDESDRKIVYMYYAGQEKRDRLILKCHENIEKMNALIVKNVDKNRTLLEAVIKHIPEAIDSIKKCLLTLQTSGNP